MESYLVSTKFPLQSLKSRRLMMTLVTFILLVTTVGQLFIVSPSIDSKVDMNISSWSNSSHSETADSLDSAKCQGIAGCVGHQQDGDYLTRRYIRLQNDRYEISFELKNKSHSHDGSDWRPLRIFTIKDVVVCFDSLLVKRNQRPMHIVFMGDSTVRQHFISFLQVFPDYDRYYQRNSTLFAEYYFHEDRNATSQILNVLVSFYWRNLLRGDLLNDFQRWSTTPDDSTKKPDAVPSIPDLIVIGVGSHHLRHNEITHRLEDYEYILERMLLPLMKNSLKNHPHLEMIWVHQSPTNDYVGPVFSDKTNNLLMINNEKIRHYNRSIRRILKNSGIVMWDSVNMIVEDYLQACALNQMLRDDKLEYLNCDDFIHPGYIALSISTQLLINHICAAA